MAVAASSSPPSEAAADAVSDRQWFIAGRWQEYEGEARANLLRVVAIGAFYGVQLYSFYVLDGGQPQRLPLHQQITAIAVAWTLLALATMLCLRQRIFPAGLKYVTTAGDIVLLTMLVHVAGGPRTALVHVYFLILALAALRFSLGLVWGATLGCLVAYEGLVGAADAVWFDQDHVVPVIEQLLTLASLGLTGLFIGQVVRRVRGFAEDYARRLSAARGAA